jgi:hypothetical protein
MSFVLVMSAEANLFGSIAFHTTLSTLIIVMERIILARCAHRQREREPATIKRSANPCPSNFSPNHKWRSNLRPDQFLSTKQLWIVATVKSAPRRWDACVSRPREGPVSTTRDLNQ